MDYAQAVRLIACTQVFTHTYTYGHSEILKFVGNETGAKLTTTNRPVMGCATVKGRKRGRKRLSNVVLYCENKYEENKRAAIELRHFNTV